MSFGLCNTLATFQKCIMFIFLDMVEQAFEVLIGDFLVFRESCDNCLHNLENVLKRCEETNSVLN